MIAWICGLFRRSRVDHTPASTTVDAINEAREVRDRLDDHMATRRHEAASTRLDQMRIRRDLREDVLSVQGRIAGDYRRELRRPQ